jgi:hypothetical protein
LVCSISLLICWKMSVNRRYVMIFYHPKQDRGTIIYITRHSHRVTSVESHLCECHPFLGPSRDDLVRSVHHVQAQGKKTWSACANRQSRGCGSQPNRRVIIVTVHDKYAISSIDFPLPRIPFPISRVNMCYRCCGTAPFERMR